jgi:hypothetical protein|tara:strand:+ start:274 stop:408 length:135 start_codon:yes stop_codon:yes gene_type:complete
MDKEEALKLLQEIQDNVWTCCAITMDPDEVDEQLTKLKEYIEND